MLINVRNFLLLQCSSFFRTNENKKQIWKIWQLPFSPRMDLKKLLLKPIEGRHFSFRLKKSVLSWRELITALSWKCFMCRLNLYMPLPTTCKPVSFSQTSSNGWKFPLIWQMWFVPPLVYIFVMGTSEANLWSQAADFRNALYRITLIRQLASTYLTCAYTA